MHTLRREKTKALSIEEILGLPVSAGVHPVLTPYLKRRALREEGDTGRDRNLTLKPMRAFVKGAATNPNFGDGRLEYVVSFFDDNGQDGQAFELHVPFANAMGASSSFSTLRDQVLAEAASRSYSGFTENDIILEAGITGFPEAEASNGYLTAVIDGKSVGNTTVFTNNSGRKFVVNEYAIIPTAITGLGTAPILNLGKTASAYNDIDSGLSLAFASQVDKFSWRIPDNNAVKVNSGESLVIRVATAAILTTAYSFKVLVRGVYID